MRRHALFSAPSFSAWRAVAVAMTDPTFPVPTVSGIFAIIFSIFGAIVVVVPHYAYTGKWEKYRVYHLDMMCIGLAVVLPQTLRNSRGNGCSSCILLGQEESQTLWYLRFRSRCWIDRW
ncbi:hypothetical protein BDV97DRAFT_64427 [Delphinella strobiligena]|nr:hypothetical protein BDV97DRAFT_64427 [Delphinella strobiligena]